MKKTSFLATAALLLAAATAPAQTVTFSVEIASTVFTMFSTGNDVQINGLAAGPAGTPIYVFDSISQKDGIVKYESSALTDLLTEATIQSTTGYSPLTGASGNALTIARSGALAGNLFYIGRIGGGEEVILRVTPAGTPTTLVARADAQDAAAIALDEANDRAYLVIDTFGDGAIEEIRYTTMSGSEQDPILLVDKAAILAQLSSGSTQVSISDLAVLNDGNLVISNGFGTAKRGDILKVTTGGSPAVSMLIPSDTILAAVNAAVGGTPSTELGEMVLETLPSGKVLMVCNSGTGNANVEFFATFNADGTGFQVIATEQNVIDAVPGLTDIAVNGKSLHVIDEENFLFGIEGAFDGVIKATISNPMKSDNWIIYQ